MLLDKLIIRDRNTKDDIRVINFNPKGLSLITDISTNSDSNGNNVGKTTALQIINICLGAEINTLYQIEENKSQDKNYQSYLQNNIEFELFISRDGLQYKIHIICSEKPSYYINSIEYNRDKFRKRIQEILFGFTEKPSLGDLKRKYFRLYDNSTTNIYKVLDYRASNLDYEVFYLYLFGFNKEENITVLNNKLKYSEEIKKLPHIDSKELKKFKKETGELEQKIEIFKKQKENKQLNEYQESLLKELADIQDNIYKKRWELITLENRISSNKETQKLLDVSTSSIQSMDLQSIYNQANLLVDKIQVKFDEMLLFHNTMLVNKKEYLNKNLNELQQEYKKIRDQLQDLSNQENSILEKIESNSEENLLGIYDEIVKEILDTSKKKAKLDEKISNLETIKAKISEFNKRITECNNAIMNFYEGYKYNITLINNYIADIISTCNIKEPLGFEIKKVSGMLNLEFSKNVKNSDGILRLHMLIFDIAYLQLSQEKGFGYPNFIVHDRLESIDNNYLNAVFKYVQEKTDIQLIASVLSSKVTINISDLEKVSVLKLSNQSGKKLFKKDIFV